MGTKMTAEERRKRRQQKKKKDSGDQINDSFASDDTDSRFAELLTKDEDGLLNFVAQVNKVYQELLRKPAPFMTFVFCGMQSAGKSTVMERFLNSALNIVQEGTGTRCPLDTTCIHDDSCPEPSCDLSGVELEENECGENLNVGQVFRNITNHNRRLGNEDRFSTEPLYLVYRSRTVQNMRFVDTPGIISNKSTGKDNRQDIQKILSSEMRKPNTKLCVLLEPKEFATNPIVEFCDSSLGGRKEWIKNATFLMTKFDKQLEDSRTGSKANNFFKEFLQNSCKPHLVITPTLAKEDLPPEKLFKARQELLASADEYEKQRFSVWLDNHDLFRQEHNDDERLNSEIFQRIGFASAKRVMREIMLTDTAKRLPEVLSSLRDELNRCQKEIKTLRDEKKFHDPKELKVVVSNMLWYVEQRILSYLDGDLESAMKFPDKLQTLEEEIDEEEQSEWATRELNHFSEAEDNWRDRIASLEGFYPKEIQAEKQFLGGKQVQRAIEFFRYVMIDALPNPFELSDKVANVTGYLSGGLQRENWERAMVQITKVCVKEVSHPGINYLIKHVGSIFRRLFSLALEDIKQGEEFSATFKLLPNSVEKFLVCNFDKMLWDLLTVVAEKTHCSLEPMYSSVDPNLPTFHASKLDDNMTEQEYYIIENGQYQRLKHDREKIEESMSDRFKSRLAAFLSGSGTEAKQLLKSENIQRAMSKMCFLPDERTSMITDEETSKILRRSFEYIVALMEFNLVTLKFQLNHYLYHGFKTELSQTFHNNLIHKANWDSLVEENDGVDKRISELEKQINGLKDSLQDVERMQRKM